MQVMSRFGHVNEKWDMDVCAVVREVGLGSCECMGVAEEEPTTKRG